MMTFQKYNDRYEAVGLFGTCYTIIEEAEEGEPTLYYTEHNYCEWDTLEEAKAHCELMDKIEGMLDELARLGVQAFDCEGDLIDLRLQLGEAAYVYCPSLGTAQKFAKVTEDLVETCQLDHYITPDLYNGGAHLYHWEHDEYEEVDSAIATIIYNAMRG